MFQDLQDKSCPILKNPVHPVEYTVRNEETLAYLCCPDSPRP